jgi:NTE family protein
MAAIETRLLGSSGFFHPRTPDLDPFRFRSFYDLAPMRNRLMTLVDFGRLNSGEPRISIAATDLESGDPVIFDSHHTRLGIDHLLASCGFLPEFAPVEIGGRLLGDGGLSLNAPFDPIVEDLTTGDLLLYVVDLYARDGERPLSLEAAVERKNDLMLANQTFIRLAYLGRARRLEMERERKPGASTDRIFLLSYRPGMEEPGPEKSFELSASAFAQRWETGRLDMEYAQTLPSADVITIVRRSKRRDRQNARKIRPSRESDRERKRLRSSRVTLQGVDQVDKQIGTATIQSSWAIARRHVAHTGCKRQSHPSRRLSAAVFPSRLVTSS